jgi:AsmA protein
MPTGWARRQIVARLEARSGRRVELEGVSIGLTGGIRLTNLAIGSPRDTRDPWLKAAEVRLDFGLWRLLGGHCQPARLEADGVELRVLRRGDGTVELADLVRPAPPPAPRSAPEAATMPGPRVAVQVRSAAVTVVDEPTRTRLVLKDVDGDGYAEGPLAVVEQLGGTINGGRFQFTAELDRTRSALSAKARLRTDDVALDDGMNILRYVVPVLSGGPAPVKGRMNGELYAEGSGPTWPDLVRRLAGHGAVAIDRLTLDGAPLIAEISRIAEFGGRRRFGSVRTEFVFRERRITTDHFTLHVGRMPITMSGWTDLDGRVDYQMKIGGLKDGLPDQARRILGELKLDVRSLSSVALRGTLDRMVVQVGGVPIDTRRVGEARPRLRPDDREQLRLLGRQLRDEFLR